MNTALWLLLPALIGCSDDPTPVGRYSHIGAVSGDGSRLFIAGGSDGPTKLVDAWSFDLSEHRWTPEAPIPQASHRAIAVGLDEDQALVYGGTSWEEEETSDVHKWNLFTGTWELSQEDAPGPRYKHAAATDGERIWVMGGRNNDGDEPVVYDELWVRDGSGAWRSLPMDGSPGPLFRQGLAWDPQLERLWVYGGINDINERSDALYSYAPDSETWELHTPSGDRPPVMASHTLVWLEGRLLAWGGHSSDTQSWTFDTAEQRWQPRDQPGPSPRDAQVSLLSPDQAVLYIVGGDNFGASGNDFLSDVWAMNTSDGSWTQLKETGYGEP